MKILINLNILFSFFILILSQDIEDDPETDQSNQDYSETEILEQNGSILTFSNYRYIRFDSENFENNEIMHFKIIALNSPNNFYKLKASYKYINLFDNNDDDNLLEVNFKINYDLMNENGNEFIVRYFDITKIVDEFGTTSGNLLLIRFYVSEGPVIISNFINGEEKEGEDGKLGKIKLTENKLKDWEVAVIIGSTILGVVIIIVIIIIFVIKSNSLKIGGRIFRFNGNNIQQMRGYKKSKNKFSRQKQQLIRQNNGRYNRNNRANKSQQMYENYRYKRQIAHNINRRIPIKSKSQYENSPSSLRKVRMGNP